MLRTPRPSSLRRRPGQHRGRHDSPGWAVTRLLFNEKLPPEPRGHSRRPLPSCSRPTAPRRAPRAGRVQLVASCRPRLFQLSQELPRKPPSGQSGAEPEMTGPTCSEEAGRPHCNPGRSRSPSRGTFLVVKNWNEQSGKMI